MNLKTPRLEEAYNLPKWKESNIPSTLNGWNVKKQYLSTSSNTRQARLQRIREAAEGIVE